MQNNDGVNNRHITPHMWLFLKLAVLAFGTVLFKYYGGNYVTEEIREKLSESGIEKVQDNVSTNKNFTEFSIHKIHMKEVIAQPSCPKSYLLVILDEICEDLLLKREFCKPEDVHNLAKHKIPKSYIMRNNKSSGSESQGSAVNGVLGALLAASVAAALVELHRARRRDGGGDGRRRRQPPSRKCSLADLTVLKHQRRELVRRESVLEPVGENGSAGRAGFRPPLLRRCSFPVGPLATIHRSDHASRPPPPPAQSRRGSAVAVESRRPSVVAESRRGSVLTDRSVGGAMGVAMGGAVSAAGGAMCGRRVSVDAELSPRHHTRLVHRH